MTYLSCLYVITLYLTKRTYIQFWHAYYLLNLTSATYGFPGLGPHGCLRELLASGMDGSTIRCPTGITGISGTFDDKWPGGDVKQWRIPNTNGVPKWRQTMPSTMAAPSFTGGLDTVWMMAISGSPDNSDDWRNPSSAIVSNGVQAGLISGSGVYLVLERSYLSVVQLSVGLPCRNSQIDGKRPILAYSGLD